jgi:hypothetical protein
MSTTTAAMLASESSLRTMSLPVLQGGGGSFHAHTGGTSSSCCTTTLSVQTITDVTQDALLHFHIAAHEEQQQPCDESTTDVVSPSSILMYLYSLLNESIKLVNPICPIRHGGGGGEEGVVVVPFVSTTSSSSSKDHHHHHHCPPSPPSDTSIIKHHAEDSVVDPFMSSNHHHHHQCPLLRSQDSGTTSSGTTSPGLLLNNSPFAEYSTLFSMMNNSSRIPTHTLFRYVAQQHMQNDTSVCCCLEVHFRKAVLIENIYCVTDACHMEVYGTGPSPIGLSSKPPCVLTTQHAEQPTNILQCSFTSFATNATKNSSNKETPHVSPLRIFLFPKRT